MRYWDKPEGKTLQINEITRYRRNGQYVSRMTGATALLWILTTACRGPVAPAAVETAAADTSVPEAMGSKANDLACGADGRLTVELYGSISASIDWRSDALACAGMPRPENEGARVRMSGPLATGDEVRTIAFILGLPDLEVGQSGNELPTNVTLIEEGTGRFYSTPDTSGCWTDVRSQLPIGADNDQLYRIEGTLYCISPLAELNGSTSVTFTELNFTGRINWEQPK